MDIKLIYIGHDDSFSRILYQSARHNKIAFETVVEQAISALTKQKNLIIILDADQPPDEFRYLPELFRSDNNLAVFLQSKETGEKTEKNTDNQVEISAILAGLAHDILVKTDNQRLLDKKICLYVDYLCLKLPENTTANTNDLLRKNHSLSRQISNLQEQISQIDSDLHVQEKVLDKITQISQLSRKVNCLHLKKIASVCIEQIPRLISARFASLYTFDQENRVLHLLQYNHPYEISSEIDLLKNPNSPMAMAIKQKKLMLISDFGDMPKDAKSRIDRKFTRNYNTNSCIIAPLISGDRILGVLNLADKIDAPRFSNKSDLPPIELLCDIVGSAMSNIELYEQVQKRARTDSMTNLLNHHTFYNMLDKEVHRSSRYGNSLSLVMVDLDNLKQLNDSYGHLAGDAVLKYVADKISHCIRDIDIAARYGGDEFAIILPNTSTADAVNVAERLVKLVAGETIAVDKLDLTATISVGLSQYRPGQSVQEFMAEADNAMFNAKSAGKNQIQISNQPTA